MSVSPTAPVSAPAPAQRILNNPGQDQRAADGDYPTPGPGRSAIKDADGDYKPTAAQMTSSAVQAAVTDIKLGG